MKTKNLRMEILGNRNWKQVEIGDITKVTSGGTPSRKKTEYYKEGTIPWVKTGDLKVRNLHRAGEFITEEGLNSSSAKLFPSNTVLLAMYGATIGACSILKIPAATNQACAAILPNELLNENYLYYFFKGSKQNLIRKGVGGAQPNISGGIIKKTKIPLPPLPIQKQIAEILNTADALRRETAAQLADLEALAQSVFLEMFGDPVLNEKGWNLVKLETVCTKITDGTHKTPKYQNDGVIFLSAKNIKNYQLNQDNPKYISQEEHEQLTKRSKVEKGDVLITKSGSLGMSALVKFDFEFSIFESLALMKYKRDVVNGQFLVHFLNTPSTQFQYKRMTKGVGVKHLHLKDLRSIKFILPPLDVQTQFAQIIQNIESQKAALKQSLQESEDLFNGLLQEVFG